jgi:hypothetical protein
MYAGLWVPQGQPEKTRVEDLELSPHVSLRLLPDADSDPDADKAMTEALAEWLGGDCCHLYERDVKTGDTIRTYYNERTAVTRQQETVERQKRVAIARDVSKLLGHLKTGCAELCLSYGDPKPWADTYVYYYHEYYFVVRVCYFFWVSFEIVQTIPRVCQELRTASEIESDMTALFGLSAASSVASCQVYSRALKTRQSLCIWVAHGRFADKVAPVLPDWYSHLENGCQLQFQLVRQIACAIGEETDRMFVTDQKQSPPHVNLAEEKTDIQTETIPEHEEVYVNRLTEDLYHVVRVHRDAWCLPSAIAKLAHDTQSDAHAISPRHSSNPHDIQHDVQHDVEHKSPAS